MGQADITVQRKILTQALGGIESRIGLLLGAGCAASVKNASGDALIPTILPLTESVCQQLETTQPLSDALAKLRTSFGPEKPTIEHLLSRVRSLRDVAGVGEVHGLNVATLDELDQAICRHIQEVVRVDLPPGDNAYTLFARWTREIVRRHAVEVFTTNYDLLLEQAFERTRAAFFDGFIGSFEPFFDLSSMDVDTLPSRWTRLWKLHGSINWKLTAQQSVVRSAEHGLSVPLIFPSHLKYAESRRLPYLAMRDRLRGCVSNRVVFVTCGYSFADEHLNEDLVAGLAASPASVCFALLFGPLSGYDAARKLAGRHLNLNLVAEDGGVIRGQDVLWSSSQAKPLGDFDAFGRFLVDEVMGEAEL